MDDKDQRTAIDADQPGDDSADPTIQDVMHAARIGDAVEEDRALADVKARMFGRTSRPTMLSRYVLLERLGAGALGVVYEGMDPELERKVAIKLLRTDPAVGGRRLIAEARAIARVDHPNVIAVHDVGTYDMPELSTAGTTDQGVFVVMDLVRGVDLMTWVRQPGRATSQVLAVFAGAARGLAAAHRAGLVHRDFKPANVVVDDSGRARVLDFGLARPGSRSSASGSSGEGDEALDDSSTRGVGTPAYMAPEQHRGDPIDARSDQYAFCVTLYEALFGERPYRGGGPDALYQAKLLGPLDGAQPQVPVPGRVIAALRRGLAPAPSDRLDSMDDLVAALEPSPHRRWIGVIAVSAIVAGLIVVAAPESADCDDGARVREHVWGRAAREGIEDRFALSTARYATRTWEHVDSRVVAYMEQWARLQRSVCEQSHAESLAITDANRMRRCLDRGPEAVASIAEILEHATARDIEHAISLVERLPSLEVCRQAVAVLPTDDLRREVTRLQTLHAVARYEDVVADAEAVAERAAAAERPDVAAWAHLWLGKAHANLGHVEEAHKALFAAQTSAERSEDAVAAHRVAVELAALALDRARFDEAEGWLTLAASRAGRGGISLVAQLEGDLQRTRLAWGRGDDDAGELLATAVIRRATPELGSRHSLVARALTARARVQARRGQHESAIADFAEARDVLAALVGAEHPSTGQAEQNHAAELLDVGRPEEALAALAAARTTLVASLGEGHRLVAALDGNRVAALAVAERLDEAVALGLEVVQRLEASRGKDHPEVAMALVNVSGLEVESGAVASGVAHAEQALAIAESSLGSEHPTTLIARANRARSWIAAGRNAEAHADLVPLRDRFAERFGESDPNLASVDKLLEQSASPPAD